MPEKKVPLPETMKAPFVAVHMPINDDMDDTHCYSIDDATGEPFVSWVSAEEAEFIAAALNSYVS
jgi:hypothetical protein